MPDPTDSAEVRALVDEQAEDEGLWFVAQTAPEAYLQQELRRLHAAIEDAAPREAKTDDAGASEGLREALAGAEEALRRLVSDGWSSLSERQAIAAANEARAALEAEPPSRTGSVEGLDGARDLVANYLWNEDDSGDENDLIEAYDILRDSLGPSTEDSVGATLARLHDLNVKGEEPG